jgi:tetratricopeptide (TPR) repeat protein
MYYYPKVEHAIALGLHLTVSCLIFIAFGNDFYSFMAALLFLFNPVFLQGGIWLSGKGYAQATIMCLMAFILPDFAPLFLLPTAMMSLNTIFLPVVFLFTPYKWMAFSSIAILYFYYRTLYKTDYKGIKESAATPPMTEVSWKKTIIGFRTFSYYILLIIFPIRLGMYHDFLYRFGNGKIDTDKEYVLDYLFYSGIVLFGLFLAGVITNFNGIRIHLLWYFSTIIIFGNFFKMYHQPITERYCYLPGIGLMLTLARLLPTEAIFILLGCYITRNYLQLGAYKDDYKWLEYNAYDFNFPKQAFVPLLQGLSAEINRKDPLLAMQYWKAGLELCPHDDKLNFHMANTLSAMGRWKEALPYIIKADETVVQVKDKRSLCFIVPQFRGIIERKIESLNKNKDNLNYNPMDVEFKEKLLFDERKLREQEVVVY